jgi:DNA-binding HxlR family transcriptional regulator
MSETMDLVGRRWSAVIMIAIGMGAQRFGEIKRLVDGISDRMLSQRLKELADEGLVERTVVPTTPAHSVYTLTETGRGLMIALQPLVRWGHEHMPPARS